MLTSLLPGLWRLSSPVVLGEGDEDVEEAAESASLDHLLDSLFRRRGFEGLVRPAPRAVRCLHDPVQGAFS